MKISLPRFSRRLLAIVLLGFAAPALWAQNTTAASGPTVASLNEDVQLLTRQVNQLRLEVEALRQANDDLQKQIVTQRDVQSTVQNAVAASRADTRNDIAASRKEILDGVAKQIEALTKDTNAQLQKLAKAIGSPGGSVSSGAPASSAAPTRKFDTNYPATGISYVVKPRDSLSKIARENNSTVDWIQNANQIENPDRDLQAGQKIFIPQKPAAATPAPAPANN